MTDPRPRCDHQRQDCRCYFQDRGTPAVHLDNGMRLVWAIDADGTRTPWLLDPEHRDGPVGTIPAHERTGPLPGWFRDLIQLMPAPRKGRSR